MRDIANQLVLKWARLGPENRILATDDFTRLTLDTIALCMMKYRFNSFYSDDMHPFIEAMLFVLQENGARAMRPPFVTAMKFSTNQKHAKAVAVMDGVCQDVINERKKNPTNEEDLLNTMLFGKDPKTGESMRDELIAAQLKNFLVAGQYSVCRGRLALTNVRP